MKLEIRKTSFPLLQQTSIYKEQSKDPTLFCLDFMNKITVKKTARISMILTLLTTAFKIDISDTLLLEIMSNTISINKA